MDRRSFLKSSSAAALGVGTASQAAAHDATAAGDSTPVTAPAVVSQRRTLRLVSAWPDAVFGAGDHVRRFAKRIEAATDGRLTIDVAGPAVAGTDAFNAVMTGEADLFAGHEHAHRDLHPAFSYFAGLPCKTGMGIHSMNAWLVAAGGQELWDELAGDFDIKGLVIGHSGRGYGLYTRQPIRELCDLRGKTIAAAGLAADVLAAAGAEPTSGSHEHWADLYATAHLDGVDAIGSHFDRPLVREDNFDTVGKPPWRSPPLNTSGYAITLGLRRSLWHGLANSERLIFSALASEALSASCAEARAQGRSPGHDPDYSQNRKPRSFASANDSHIDPAPMEFVATQLARLAATIVAEMSGRDAMTRRINASYMAFRARNAGMPAA